jgi:thiol-disulfide isomerase/thioredoxin
LPERLLVLLSLVGGLGALWIAVRAAARYRRARRVHHLREPGLTDGRTTVLYFTADYCTVCRYRQKPALDELKRDLDGTVRIVEVDAVRDPAKARLFGVLSLPTTVVLAPDGTVGAVNYGFAPRAQLDAQIRSIAV